MPTIDFEDDDRKRDPYDPRTGSTGDDAEPTEIDDDSDALGDDEEGDEGERGG